MSSTCNTYVGDYIHGRRRRLCSKQQDWEVLWSALLWCSKIWQVMFPSFARPEDMCKHTDCSPKPKHPMGWHSTSAMLEQLLNSNSKHQRVTRCKLYSADARFWYFFWQRRAFSMSTTRGCCSFDWRRYLSTRHSALWQKQLMQMHIYGYVNQTSCLISTLGQRRLEGTSGWVNVKIWYRCGSGTLKPLRASILISLKPAWSETTYTRSNSCVSLRYSENRTKGTIRSADACRCKNVSFTLSRYYSPLPTHLQFQIMKPTFRSND